MALLTSSSSECTAALAHRVSLTRVILSRASRAFSCAEIVFDSASGRAVEGFLFAAFTKGRMSTRHLISFFSLTRQRRPQLSGSKQIQRLEAVIQFRRAQAVLAAPCCAPSPPARSIPPRVGARYIVPSSVAATLGRRPPIARRARQAGLSQPEARVLRSVRLAGAEKSPFTIAIQAEYEVPES
jgi:hypothetical protein